MTARIPRTATAWILGALLLAFGAGPALGQSTMSERAKQQKEQAQSSTPAGAPATQAPAPAGPGQPAQKEAPVTAMQRLREQALEKEKAVELPDALLRWQYMLQLNPKHKEAAAHVEVLKAQIKLLADSHFERGVALYRAKQREEAMREFLLVLAYDPNNGDAMDYVRNKLHPPDWVYYTTVQGDSMKVVSKKAYQDEGKDFLVAAYNNLSRNAQLSPGMVLKLPIIESDLRKPSVNVAETLNKAKAMMAQGQYDEAIATAESILVYDPGNTTAREVTNASYYKQGKDLAAENKMVEALAAFKNADPGYRDVKETIASLQNNLKGVAEEHYKKGVQFFVDEKLDEAISEWEQTLRIDPNHPKAAKDLENARQLRERLEQVSQ